MQGNSAGGHLAAWSSTDYSDRVERPDFSVLFYPVITMDHSLTHRGSQHYLLGNNPSEALCAQYSAEKRVNADTPPAFLMHCTDDGLVPVSNSIKYYEALVKNNIKYSSMYIMPVGGHGWTDRQFEYRDAWMTALKTWLLELPNVLK